jgi:hypothetical protein
MVWLFDAKQHHPAEVIACQMATSTFQDARLVRWQVVQAAGPKPQALGLSFADRKDRLPSRFR